MRICWAGMCGPALVTGNLVRAVLDAFPEARVFGLGGNAYDQGTEREYRQCYDAAWGSFNERTAPVPGNHDYRSAGAKPYFDYFDDHPQARERGGYYSLDLENWHVVAINSHISMEEGSPQVEWLKADLRANDKACILACWHHPLFSFGRHGALPWSPGRDTEQLWEVLNRHGGDLIVNGHERFYERFRPQNRFGEATPRGMRQIIVGTGGARLQGVLRRRDNGVYLDNDHYGVLVLTLHPYSYEWAFLGTDGELHDASDGPVPCRDPDPTVS
ncbi:MAG: metallophosphoesterase [Candidatus Competibacteraceae bacterium]|nr:metallophosphoesterase [Candidatus Competibacteraceae bacterium]